MTQNFKAKPRCERCHKRRATFFCAFPNPQWTQPAPADIGMPISFAELDAMTDSEMAEQDAKARATQRGRYTWQFTCESCAESARYPLELYRFFHSPAGTVDWLAHLNGKLWMNGDDFLEMMERFRESTQSYCQL